MSLAPHRVKNIFCGLLVALFAASCTTPVRPPSPKEEIAVWLSEARRTLAVDVNPELPEPDLRSRDHKVGKRILLGAGGGVVGAGEVWLKSCHAGPMSCVVGLFLSPLGFIAGAAGGAGSVESEETFHDLKEVKGASSLLQTTKASLDVKALVTTSIVSVARKAGGHTLRDMGAAREKVPPGSDAVVELDIDEFGLLGELGDDPDLGLVLRATALIRMSEGAKYVWHEFKFEGEKRRLSKWRADRAALFRQEFTNAVDAWARSVVKRLNARPSEAAVARVFAKRQRVTSAREGPTRVGRAEPSEAKPDAAAPPRPALQEEPSIEGELSAEQIRSVLLGMTLVSPEAVVIGGRIAHGGTVDCYLFHSFQTASVVETTCLHGYGSVKQNGRWWVNDEQRLCLKWPTWFWGSQQCYRVAKSGDRLTFTDDKDQKTVFRMMKG